MFMFLVKSQFVESRNKGKYSYICLSLWGDIFESESSKISSSSSCSTDMLSDLFTFEFKCFEFFYTSGTGVGRGCPMRDSGSEQFII